jgi:plasmid stabilization system protein ParE
MYKVKITTSAKNDLIEIFNYVATQSEQRAIALLEKIEKQILSLH